jgi:hypothetical protein
MICCGLLKQFQQMECKSGRGYKVFVSNANQLKYNGLLPKGDQVKIELVKGWN